MHGTSPLEEVIRVLAPGGTLEIIEMGLVLPPSCPPATKLAFSEYLLKNVINPDPSVPIKFDIHAVEGLVLSTFAKPAYHKTWRLPSAEGACKGKGKAEDTPPAAIAEASTIWMRSVLEYSKVAMGGTTSKGPSLGLAGEDANTKTSEPADARFIDALRGLGNRWAFGATCENKEKKVCKEGKTAQGLDAENAALLAPKPECNEIQLWAWVGRKKG